MPPRRSVTYLCITHISHVTQWDFDELLDDTSYVDLPKILYHWETILPVPECYRGMPNPIEPLA